MFKVILTSTVSVLLTVGCSTSPSKPEAPARNTAGAGAAEECILTYGMAASRESFTLREGIHSKQIPISIASEDVFGLLEIVVLNNETQNQIVRAGIEGGLTLLEFEFDGVKAQVKCL